MPDQPRPNPFARRAARDPRTPGFTSADWNGRQLLTCDDCPFDTLDAQNMQTHRTMGCRPPDGEWDAEKAQGAPS